MSTDVVVLSFFFGAGDVEEGRNFLILRIVDVRREEKRKRRIRMDLGKLEHDS